MAFTTPPEEITGGAVGPVPVRRRMRSDAGRYTAPSGPKIPERASNPPADWAGPSPEKQHCVPNEVNPPIKSAARSGLRSGPGFTGVAVIGVVAGSRWLWNSLKVHDPRNFPWANVMAGSSDGHTFYVRGGYVPRRPPGVDYRRPLAGNTSSTAEI